MEPRVLAKVGLLPLVELSDPCVVEAVGLDLLELKLPDLGLELGLLGEESLELP